MDSLNTVVISSAEYKRLIEAAHNAEILRNGFHEKVEATAWGRLVDSDIFDQIFAALYPEDYRRIVKRCEEETKKKAQAEAAEAEDA